MVKKFVGSIAGGVLICGIAATAALGIPGEASADPSGPAFAIKSEASLQRATIGIFTKKGSPAKEVSCAVYLKDNSTPANIGSASSGTVKNDLKVTRVSIGSSVPSGAMVVCKTDISEKVSPSYDIVLSGGTKDTIYSSRMDDALAKVQGVSMSAPKRVEPLDKSDLNRLDGITKAYNEAKGESGVSVDGDSSRNNREGEIEIGPPSTGATTTTTVTQTVTEKPAPKKDMAKPKREEAGKDKEKVDLKESPATKAPPTLSNVLDPNMQFDPDTPEQVSSDPMDLTAQESDNSEESSSSFMPILLVILAVAGVSGAGYFFLKKRGSEDEDDDSDDDDDDNYMTDEDSGYDMTDDDDVFGSSSRRDNSGPMRPSSPNMEEEDDLFSNSVDPEPLITNFDDDFDEPLG